MDTLHSVLIVAATVLAVLVFCSGIKAACRKILDIKRSRNKTTLRKVNQKRKI